MRQSRKPTHPGVFLREEVLKPLNLSIEEAASRLDISRKKLSALINEKISLSPEMAVRIARATRTSSQSWLGMQEKLDVWEAEHKEFHSIPFPYIDEEGILKEV